MDELYKNANQASASQINNIHSKFMGEDSNINPYDSKHLNAFEIDIMRTSQNMMKNRPFSSENKYGNKRRVKPNVAASSNLLLQNQ